MAANPARPSARRVELLEAAYRYVLDQGLTDLSLRPLAAAVGSSPRVLMFLFGNKDGLVRALLERARTDELALLARIRTDGEHSAGLTTAAGEIWAWLRADDHRALLRLWTEAYARSLIEPDGPWAGFATATVTDWLDVLAGCQRADERDTATGTAQRTLTLAILRGALLDLLASGDVERTDSAVHYQLGLLDSHRLG